MKTDRPYAHVKMFPDSHGAKNHSFFLFKTKQRFKNEVSVAEKRQTCWYSSAATCTFGFYVLGRETSRAFQCTKHPGTFFLLGKYIIWVNYIIVTWAE